MKIAIPEPKKLPSGQWFIRMRLGGKSIPVTRDTKSKCVTDATYIKMEYLQKANDKKQGRYTVGEAMSEYIDSLPPSTSPSTRMGYDIIRRNRFQDIIETYAEDVDWQKEIDRLALQYSPKTIKNTWGFMQSCLLHIGITVPKIRLPRDKKEERNYLQPKEILAVVERIRGENYELETLLCLHSLRRSEAMALRHEDIDLERNVIHVRGAVVPDEDRTFVRKETTKTYASMRDIPIMIPRVKELVAQRIEEGVPLWHGYADCVYRLMRRISKELGLPECGCHSLRHSFCSLSYYLGMSELECMTIGGWSNYSTMRDIYTHIATDKISEAANKMTGFYAETESNRQCSANGK